MIGHGMNNAVEHVIKGDNGKLDQILGPGSAKVISVIDCRFKWMMPSLLDPRLDLLMNTIFGVT
jgi:hypothetical protein